MTEDEIVHCPICHGGGRISWDDTPDGLFPNLPIEGDTRVTTGLRRNGRGEAAIDALMDHKRLRAEGRRRRIAPRTRCLAPVGTQCIVAYGSCAQPRRSVRVRTVPIRSRS